MTTGDGVNLSRYDEVLKTFYLEGIQEYVNHSTPLMDILERNGQDVSGKNATIEAHYGRSTGTGARADQGALPSPGYQKFKTCTVPMKYIYGRIELSGPSLAATRDPRGSYINAMDAEVRGIAEDLRKECNRMLWGCGYGILGRWRSTESGTSYTLQKKYLGNSAGGDGFGSTFGAKYLNTQRGDGVPVVATSYGSTTNGTFTVDTTDIAVSAVTKAADYDTVTVTDPDVTEAAGTFYVRPASLGAAAASGAQRLEMMGLRGIVSDKDLDDIACTTADETTTGLKTTFNDALQGLAVATYPWFTALVLKHPSGRYKAQRALTLNLMQTGFDMLEERAGKEIGPNLMLTTRAIRREYLELCTTDRIAVNTMKLDGGWDALSYNGVPFLVDNDAIDGEIYYLTTKDLAIYWMADFNWMQKDGAVLSRISGYDIYEAVLFAYMELGVKTRRNQAVICDLAYTKDSSEGDY